MEDYDETIDIYQLDGIVFLNFRREMLIFLLFPEPFKNAGRELNTESFVAGLEQIKEWSTIFESSPMTFGADQHLGTNKFYLSQIQGGKWVKLAGPMTF